MTMLKELQYILIYIVINSIYIYKYIYIYIILEHCFKLNMGDRIYTFSTEFMKIRNQWVDAIREVIYIYIIYINHIYIFINKKGYFFLPFFLLLYSAKKKEINFVKSPLFSVFSTKLFFSLECNTLLS